MVPFIELALKVNIPLGRIADKSSFQVVLLSNLLSLVIDSVLLSVLLFFLVVIFNSLHRLE